MNDFLRYLKPPHTRNVIKFIRVEHTIQPTHALHSLTLYSAFLGDVKKVNEVDFSLSLSSHPRSKHGNLNLFYISIFHSLLSHPSHIFIAIFPWPPLISLIFLLQIVNVTFVFSISHPRDDSIQRCRKEHRTRREYFQIVQKCQRENFRIFRV